jgi:flagellar biosynthesis protein FlhB
LRWAPLLLGAMFIAIVINMMQVGLFFSAKRIQPNFGAQPPRPEQNLQRAAMGSFNC